MVNRFNDFVFKSKPNEKLMPLTHQTNGLNFRDIITSCQIKPHKCDIFNEDLLYFFYGRPAFRINSNNTKSSRALQNYPICFLFKPDILPKAKRIYPFDTGGFILRGGLDCGIPYDNFALVPNVDTPKYIVETFFGSNAQYYSGMIKESISYDRLEFEVNSYIQFVTENAASADDRAHSIEIQSDRPVDISSSTLLAVVLPLDYLDSLEVKKALSAFGADPITYETFGRAQAYEYTALIFTAVRDYLSKNGYL